MQEAHSPPLQVRPALPTFDGIAKREDDMATQPDDNPGDTPAETPVPPGGPDLPVIPEEAPPPGPDFDQPDTGPAELPEV